MTQIHKSHSTSYILWGSFIKICQKCGCLIVNKMFFYLLYWPSFLPDMSQMLVFYWFRPLYSRVVCAFLGWLLYSDLTVHSLSVDDCFLVYQVIEQYKKEGFEFMLQVFNEPHYLEDITGLTQMHEETIDAEVIHVQFQSVKLAYIIVWFTDSVLYKL